MKKVYLQEIKQKNEKFYSMVVDPRLIAKIRKKYTAGEAQDVQRPWIEKKVKEIAAYVAGKTIVENKKSLGLIPNTPIINIKNNLKIKSEEATIITNGSTDKVTRYYIELPETNEEICNYEDSLEIIDGQHRVIAFDENYIDPSISNNVIYEMNFNVFERLTDNKRKEIFMVTNEKQDKVATNLLRYIKKSLGLLIGDDEVVYDLLDKINSESSCPLYHRISFGSTKVKKGYAETQVSKIFKAYGPKKYYDNVVLTKCANDEKKAEDTFTQIFSNYLIAWEECSNVSFQTPASDTITKISGLRYLMYIFPEICNQLTSNKRKLSKENFKEIINKFPEALNLENVKCVFCDDTISDTDIIDRHLAFRGEGATIALAKKDIQKVIAHLTDDTIGDLL